MLRHLMIIYMDGHYLLISETARDSSAAMLATKRLAGVTPEVILRECVTHTPPPSVNKAAHSGFETQRIHHQKSKTGVSVAPQKGLMSSKNLKKKDSRAHTVSHTLFLKYHPRPPKTHQSLPPPCKWQTSPQHSQKILLQQEISRCEPDSTCLWFFRADWTKTRSTKTRNWCVK